MNERQCLDSGNVAAVLMARARAATREEWEAGVAKIWDEAVAELQTNDGFKGLLALWNSDRPRSVSVMGLWDTMEHRLAYEARSAASVRAFFNPLFEEVPDRPRYIVTNAFFAS
jgi:hypothetical protein